MRRWSSTFSVASCPECCPRLWQTPLTSSRWLIKRFVHSKKQSECSTVCLLICMITLLQRYELNITQIDWFHCKKTDQKVAELTAPWCRVIKCTPLYFFILNVNCCLNFMISFYTNKEYFTIFVDKNKYNHHFVCVPSMKRNLNSCKI